MSKNRNSMELNLPILYSYSKNIRTHNNHFDFLSKSLLFVSLLISIEAFAQQEKLTDLNWSNPKHNFGFTMQFCPGLFSYNQANVSTFYSYKTHQIFTGISHVNERPPKGERRYDRTTSNLNSPVWLFGYMWLPNFHGRTFYHVRLFYYEVKKETKTWSKVPYGGTSETKIGPVWNIQTGFSHFQEHFSFNYGLGLSGGKMIGEIYIHIGFSAYINRAINTSKP